MQIFVNKTMMKILLYCISSAFKIECIYLIFLQVFDVSCFDLGVSIEPSESPLDPPEYCK